MARESLLQKAEEVASKVRLLEHEKREAVARAQALERKVGELVSLIALAGAKVDDILKVGAKDEISQAQAVHRPVGPKGPEQFGDLYAYPQEELKRRFPHAFGLD